MGETAMALADSLSAELARRLRAAGDRAARTMEAELRAAAPRHTGELATGISVRPARLGRELVSYSLTSEANEGGFDYPAYLDSGPPVIRPTRARSLSWLANSQRVYASSVTNRHRGWWVKAGATDEAKWARIVSEALRS